MFLHREEKGRIEDLLDERDALQKERSEQIMQATGWLELVKGPYYGGVTTSYSDVYRVSGDPEAHIKALKSLGALVLEGGNTMSGCVRVKDKGYSFSKEDYLKALNQYI